MRPSGAVPEVSEILALEALVRWAPTDRPAITDTLLPFLALSVLDSMAALDEGSCGLVVSIAKKLRDQGRASDGEEILSAVVRASIRRGGAQEAADLLEARNSLALGGVPGGKSSTAG